MGVYIKGVEKPKTGRDCTDFVRWLMDEVLDEENWQMNAVANGEIICRKLKKLGMLDVVDGYYVKTQETGEWIDAEIPLESGGAMPIQVCNLCNTFYPLAHTGGGYHFCPNCGADMRGEEE